MMDTTTHRDDPASAWVCRWAPVIKSNGRVLDLACGYGRHARYLATLGLRVDAVDQDADALATLADVSGVTPLRADLEHGPWPYPESGFAGIIVTRYLHRPLFPPLMDALTSGGVLIYETFAAGQERFGHPHNPDFLLQPGELLEWVRGRFRVLGYEDGFVATPKPAMLQRICAVKI